MTDKISLGEKIRMLRKEKELTIYTLAEKAGMTPGHIANIERGVNDVVKVENIEKLAAALDVKMKDLMDGTRYKIEQIRLL